LIVDGVGSDGKLEIETKGRKKVGERVEGGSSSFVWRGGGPVKGSWGRLKNQ